MIQRRPAAERGATRTDWLDGRHSFSFAGYYDPRHMGWSVLRVINDDHIAPASGFPTHGHRDMEIVTYVLEGVLAHKDSMGNGTHIRPGEIQRMSAGTGVTHSEFNGSESEPCHLLQIWIVPERPGIEPGYEQVRIAEAPLADGLRLIAAPGGGRGAVNVHQDVRLFRVEPGAGEVRYALGEDRRAWVQVGLGVVRLNGQVLEAGDGAAISDEPTLHFAQPSGEVLLFDLPA